jgi:hypothetical protein
MKYIEKLLNIDNLNLMIKCYDFVVLGIPYKKNRSMRIQKKMQKIVRAKK